MLCVSVVVYGSSCNVSVVLTNFMEKVFSELGLLFYESKDKDPRLCVGRVLSGILGRRVRYSPSRGT